MKVVVNPDGSTTVSCDGSSVTINPPSPADPKAGGVSDPGTVSALIARRRRAVAKPEDHTDADAPDRALILHGPGEIDVGRIRRLLDDAGLKRVAIEITPAAHDG